MDYREEFLEAAEGNEEYAKFNARVVKSGKKVLGVRAPDMGKIIKKMAKGMEATDVEKFMGKMRTGVYEDVSLAGNLIATVKMSEEERIRLTRKWLADVDSWAFTDGDIARMKKFDRELWGKFVDECLRSGKEFYVRFGVIFMMKNWLDDLDFVFSKLREIEHEGYYVKMAMAWTYAEAALRDYPKTMKEMEREDIDAWTRRKGLTKMVESFRLTPEQKVEIKALRGKIKK